MQPRLRCRRIFTLIALVFLASVGAGAQTGRVTLAGKVSETVTLSVSPSFTHGNVAADVVSSGNTVRITLTSSNTEATVIRVPLLVRSNSGFKISATAESQAALLPQLSVSDVRATGTLVSSAAVSGLVVDDSQPTLVVSGPRVSLGGNLISPNNALQITVTVSVKPEPAPGSLLHLTFVATAVPQTR